MKPQETDLLNTIVSRLDQQKRCNCQSANHDEGCIVPLLLPQQAASLHPRTDYGQACTEFAKLFSENVTQPLTKAFQAITEAIQPALKPIIEAIQHINEVVYASYLADGAIYGETQEGYVRWLRESGEAEYLRMQANHIEQHQEDMRDFKRMLAAKRLHSAANSTSTTQPG